MRGFGRHSILVRSATVLFASFFLAGAVTLGAALMLAEAREHRAAQARLEQLLDTVESTVSIACYVKDAQLAAEVIQGLRKNRTVQAVTIVAEPGAIRLGAAGADRGRSAIRLVRTVRSPFDAGRMVGRIEIDADTGTIETDIRAELRLTLAQMAGQLLLVALAVAAIMGFYIVRPIQAMSAGLHRLDATRGEHLPVPRFHAGSEIGRLVDDINGLAASLAASLGKERSLRQSLEVEERKYRAIFENAETGIFLIAPDGGLLSWNPAFAQLLDIPANEAYQGSLTLAQLPLEEPARLADMARACRVGNSGGNDEIAVRTRSGARRWLRVLLNPMGGGLLQGVVHDVTGHREAEASARRRATVDPLTGLFSRLGLEEALHARQNEMPETGFALALVDLERFRRINEGYGLPTGDAVIRDAAARLGHGVKASDILARLAGARFALVLRDVSRDEEAGRIGARILTALARPYRIGDLSILSRASLGIALSPRDGTDLAGLLGKAELALDAAKANGGNRCMCFDATLTEAAERRRQDENDLRHALANGEFLLYYQPIVDLAGQRLAGAEALIRWLHPGKGLVPPDDFIPLAETTGLIDEIGLWAVDTACAQLAEWQRAGYQRHLSVNVSGHQIPDGLSPDKLADIAARHGIEPGRLALEITEGVLLADVDKALAWVGAVRERGFRVYLDDFGTGYSSLSYLKRFRVDTLKIDRSFVRDMAEDGSDRALVEAVMAMARSLGLEVVAEGVESAGQMERLRTLRCRYAQGYHFSRPVPGPRFEAAAKEIEAMLDPRPLAA